MLGFIIPSMTTTSVEFGRGLVIYLSKNNKNRKCSNQIFFFCIFKMNSHFFLQSTAGLQNANKMVYKSELEAKNKKQWLKMIWVWPEINIIEYLANKIDKSNSSISKYWVRYT